MHQHETEDKDTIENTAGQEHGREKGRHDQEHGAGQDYNTRRGRNTGERKGDMIRNAVEQGKE